MEIESFTSLLTQLEDERSTDFLNPINQVRSSCLEVCKMSSSVKIVVENFSALVESIAREGKTFREGVEWDASGWHFSLDAPGNGPLTCQYIFVLDSLNFCFWPTPGMEYDFLASKLKVILERNNEAFSARNLMALTKEEFCSWFPGFTFPQLEERVRRLQELGQALHEEFDGLAANVVKRANFSAVSLVKLILRHFPGFRDTAVYKGRLVHFYKRAQILVGDVWAAYGRQSEATHPYYFQDISKLTMFADYRVPQILRSLGLLEYSPCLRDNIDSLREIPCGSEEEIEIRAATIIAVDLLQRKLLEAGLNLLVLEVDWILWQRGEAIKDTIAPHHRTLTVYY